MPISQNVAFTGDAEPDAEFDRPPGVSIARLLTKDLKSAGWEVSEFDNWRDCGWSLDCTRGNAQLRVVLAETGESAWMLQIAPLRMPGLVERLFGFGRRPSATASDILALAQAVHGILTQQSRFSDWKWRWDGPPSAKHSTPKPTA